LWFVVSWQQTKAKLALRKKDHEPSEAVEELKGQIIPEDIIGHTATQRSESTADQNQYTIIQPLPHIKEDGNVDQQHRTTIQTLAAAQQQYDDDQTASHHPTLDQATMLHSPPPSPVHHLHHQQTTGGVQQNTQGQQQHEYDYYHHYTGTTRRRGDNATVNYFAI
jgi:hypothetical protein